MLWNDVRHMRWSMAPSRTSPTCVRSACLATSLSQARSQTTSDVVWLLGIYAEGVATGCGIQGGQWWWSPSYVWL